MTHIIAEAGTNHNGDLNEAKILMDIAKRCGADSVKFQIINPWGLYLPGDYAYGHYDIKKVIEIRKSTVLEDQTYFELNNYGQSIDIALSASVFDEKGLDLICKLNPPYIKIASCDLNNIRFLRQVAERGLKMIVSTGMSTLNDVDKAVRAIDKGGNKDIVLLHCVSIYPAKTEQTNLLFIQELKKNFGTEVGFSDHTGESTAACMAVALGATWIEKHFTKDKNQEGFDHAYAMEENDMRTYVSDIRAAESSLEIKEIKISDNEMYTRKRARRSLYASRDIKIGDVINNDDILCVRPEGIMDADQIDLLIGSTALADISIYEPFSLNKIKR